MSATLQGSESAPMYARRNNDGHYTWKGVKHPSVTTVLGILGSEHLYHWYAKMAAQDCANFAQAALDGEMPWKEAAVEIVDVNTRRTAAIRDRDFKGAIGTLTHHALYERVLGVTFDDMVEYLEHFAVSFGLADSERDRQGDEPYARTLAKAAQHYVANAFLWLDTERPEFDAIGQEAVVISETHGYAGTKDAIAKIKGVKYAIDFKTSRSIDAFKFRAQVEAYRRADFIGLISDGSEHEIPHTDKVGILHIQPIDPPKLHIFDPSDEHFEAFLAARYIYGVTHEMPKPNARQRSTAKPKTNNKECPF